MANFSQVLIAARSSDNATRQQAEQWLRQVEETNPSAYFSELSAVVRDDSKPADVRQLAGLMIKMGLDADDEALAGRRAQRWRSIDAATSARVKSELVGALASSVEAARAAAAQAVAKIGALDVPAGAWPELVPGLVDTARAPALDAGIKAAALTAIGYLLEELSEDALPQAQVNAVLTAVVESLQPSGAISVVRAAIRAMNVVLQFAAEYFKDEHVQERNALMFAVCTAASSTDDQVLLGAYDCICTIGQEYYEALALYMNDIAKLTFGAAKTMSNDAVAVRAVEFWTVMAERETDLGNDNPACRKYILQAVAPLVEMLTELMLRTTEDDTDETYTTPQAAANCLEQISRTVGDAVLPHVMPFVNASVGAPDWHRREAATLAFGVVMQGPSHELLKPLVMNAFPVLINRLRGGATPDPHVAVRDTTAWAIGKILMDPTCEMLPLEAASTVDNIVNVLCASLNDEPRVVVNVAYALHNLAESMPNFEEKGVTPLSPHLLKVTGALIARSDRDDWDENGLRIACFEAANEVIAAAGAKDTPALMQLLQESGTRLNASLAKPLHTPDDRDEQHALQVALTAMLGQTIQRLGDAVVPVGQHVINVLTRVLDVPNATATEEAWRAIGSLADAMGAAFAPYMPELLPRLLRALTEVDQHAVALSATTATSLIASSLDDGFAAYAPPVCGCLMTALASPELDRSVKPAALSTFGDIALAIGAKFEPMLPKVMTVIDKASRTELPRDDDPDLEEYIWELRKAVAEAWIGVYIAWNTEELRKTPTLHPYTPGVLERIAVIAGELNRVPLEEVTEEQVAAGIALCGLIGDISTVVTPDRVRQCGLTRRTQWFITLHDRWDHVERQSWDEDDRFDEAGEPRTTAAQLARKALLGH